MNLKRKKTISFQKEVDIQQKKIKEIMLKERYVNLNHPEFVKLNLILSSRKLFEEKKLQEFKDLK